jgi:hypothetical protein
MATRQIGNVTFNVQETGANAFSPAEVTKLLALISSVSAAHNTNLLFANLKTVSVRASTTFGEFSGGLENGAPLIIINPAGLDLLGTDAGMSFINQFGNRVNETAARVFSS